jgi:hypothetical protein
MEGIHRAQEICSLASTSPQKIRAKSSPQDLRLAAYGPSTYRKTRAA